MVAFSDFLSDRCVENQTRFPLSSHLDQKRFNSVNLPPFSTFLLDMISNRPQHEHGYDTFQRFDAFLGSFLGEVMHVRVGHWQNLRRRLQPPEFKKTERQLLTTSCVQRLNNLQCLALLA